MYMARFNYDPGMSSCLNFYNESWVCFRDEEFGDGDVEINDIVRLAECQHDAQWHLNSLSQTQQPSQQPYIYSYNEPQLSTSVYVLDTWIDTLHSEFEGRAQMGAQFTTGNTHGHGTHVSGLIGGKTLGVNRKAQIIGVQVLNDEGYGAWSTVLAGLEWISKQPVGIINISITGPKSSTINLMMHLLWKRGWKIVVAAGNNAQDACTMSPASSPYVVTVGAFNVENKFSSFSNYGPCLNVLAPGEGVLSAYPNNLLAYMSGTSMAAPLVAGVWSATGQITMIMDAVINVPPQTNNALLYATNGGC